MSTPASLVYFSHTNVCILFPGNKKMGQFEGVSTLRCILLYRMLLWLNQFLSVSIHLYSKIFSKDPNIRLDREKNGTKYFH